MENVINDLVGYKNLKIVQCNEYFRFSLDSIILANFVEINNKDYKIIDLGCGNAPIPIILSTKTKNEIIGIEIQKEIYDLAVESISLNNLNDQIKIINDDIKNLNKLFKSDYFDIIISNPPYFKKYNESKYNINQIKTNARHEILINLEDIISESSKIIKNKGAFYLIQRTERLFEVLSLMNKYKIEPKILQFIYPKMEQESNLFLIKGIKNGNIGIKILKPLIVHKADGSYTSEINDILLK